jgi:hypothetical protein
MKTLTDSLYEKLTNEEDARACRDIADDACREVPGNFLLILSTHILTKLGDAVVSPKTVLAWLTASIGAPTAVLAMLVPIRESGSMIPQLLIGGYIRGVALRKWVWVLGSLLQGLAVLGIGGVALTLRGAEAGWAVLALLTLFSLSRGLCSIAAKDVLGKTIPKGRRGQLNGWSASAAGLLSIAVGIGLFYPALAEANIELLVALMFGAGGLWLIAAAVYGLVREAPGDTDGGVNGVGEALANLALLGNDRAFRRFVIARALLMCSALSAPFYVALAQQHAGTKLNLLGAFVVAAGAASLLSAPVWGRFADRSSRRVMFWAACLTASTGLVLVLLTYLTPGLLSGTWAIPALYFVLSIAHSGVRVGRKTYVVDLASGNRRTDYVSVSNSVIGVMLLLVGSLGLLAEQLGNAGMIGLLALMGLAGATLTWHLRETD